MRDVTEHTAHPMSHRRAWHPGNDVTQLKFYTRDPALPRRNDVHLEILKLGLMRIRGAGYSGDHRTTAARRHHDHTPQRTGQASRFVAIECGSVPARPPPSVCYVVGGGRCTRG
jgi:hypothetical protein